MVRLRHRGGYVRCSVRTAPALARVSATAGCSGPVDRSPHGSASRPGQRRSPSASRDCRYRCYCCCCCCCYFRHRHRPTTPTPIATAGTAAAAAVVVAAARAAAATVAPLRAPVRLNVQNERPHTHAHRRVVAGPRSGTAPLARRPLAGSRGRVCGRVCGWVGGRRTGSTAAVIAAACRERAPRHGHNDRRPRRRHCAPRTACAALVLQLGASLLSLPLSVPITRRSTGRCTDAVPTVCGVASAIASRLHRRHGRSRVPCKC